MSQQPSGAYDSHAVQDAIRDVTGCPDSDTIPDSLALDRIHAAMSGQEWSPDTLDIIAAQVVATGRVIAETGDANIERADRAKKTVEAYAAIVGDDYHLHSDAITDLLTDLRHRCHELDLDYDDLNGRAASYYDGEFPS